MAVAVGQYQKNGKLNQKVGGRPEQTFLQRGHRDAQQTYKKMLNAAAYSLQFSCSVVSDSL